MLGPSAGGPPLSPAVTSRDVSVPTRAAGTPGAIAGTLCSPPGATVVQVLVHGLTHGREYWDFPYEPETYSYVRRANAAGYATLAIDRLGVGRSQHPPSALVTYEANARAVHDVVQAARSGVLGARYDRVVLVGHSLGSIIGNEEAGAYRDVDAAVFTGSGHVAPGDALARLLDRAVPASSDPRFAGLDPGYRTTEPGTRDVFFHRPDTDPAVIALDERLKQTFTEAEVVTATSFLSGDVSRRITVPTFTIVGAEDPFFGFSSGAELAAVECPFFGPGAVVEARVVAGAGHDLNLERCAPDVVAAILAFLGRYVPAVSR